MKYLIEEHKADVDLNSGELEKDAYHEDENYESLEEKYFMEAYNNTMTPLQLAVVLGSDEIVNYLI